MMILKVKIRRKTLVKWAGYFLTAYLLASWGVNGVANPVHYARNARMGRMGLETEEQGENLVLKLPSGAGRYGFLSFQVVQSPEYSFQLHIAGEIPQGGMEGMDIKVWKGWNTLDISEKHWDKICIQLGTGREKLILGEIMLTQYRKADIGRMVYVMASFVILSAFWEGVWWIKRKYAT